MEMPTAASMDELLVSIRNDLHPGQLAFVDDTATQIIGISAGYGAGKTRALCAKAVMLAAANRSLCGQSLKAEVQRLQLITISWDKPSYLLQSNQLRDL